VGEAATQVGQLEGRIAAQSSAVWWSYQPETDDRALVEWLVEAPSGTVLRATARHPRAGTARAELRLK
jgi:hypothetical protein